jgi:hypothetical protein
VPASGVSSRQTIKRATEIFSWCYPAVSPGSGKRIKGSSH